MNPLIAVMDTGAGPNLVNFDFLHDDLKAKIEPNDAGNLRSANNSKLNVRGLITFFVQIGELTVPVQFGVIDDLVTDVLLGTDYIDRHIHAILPKTRKIVPNNSPSVAILAIGDRTVPVTLMKKDEPYGLPHSASEMIGQSKTEEVDCSTNCVPHQRSGKRIVRASQYVQLKPWTETVLSVTSKAAGLWYVESHPGTVHRNCTMTARGVMNIVPNEPFNVLMANLTDRSVDVHKGMKVALATDMPGTIVQLGDRANFGQASEICKVKVGEHLDFQGQLDGTVENQLEEPTDWKDKVNVSPKFEHEKAKLIEMLSKFENMWDGTLGTIKAAVHRIELEPGSRPIHQQPYRAGPTQREHERREIDKMLKAGVIEPAKTEWASPIVFAPKKDGQLRFCIDYRRLNALTIRDSYPIPRMDECIDSLGEATIFTTFDCNSGYWQIDLDEQDRDKTSFCSHFGLYRFTRMPFGLRNAPGTFQRAADVILANVKWQFSLAYLDDVIVYSRTLSEHHEHVRTILELLSNAGVTLRLRKCFFFQESIDYLGHIVRPGKLSVAAKTCEAVQRARPPTTQTELRSFLGLCNVYRRFVPSFARIAAPLNRNLMKDTPKSFELNEEQIESYEQLKSCLVKPPILALPRNGFKYVLDTDACDYQVGCVLMQEQEEGPMRPIGYWSRSLNKAERSYDTTQKECLAVVWAMLHLRPYLQGNTFVLRTDHAALRWILNMADATGKLARWRLRLLEYDYEIQHRPGVKHQAADALSRVRTDGGDETELDDEVPTFECKEDEDTDGTICEIGRTNDSTSTTQDEVEELTRPISDEEFIRGQSTDDFCQEVARTVGLPGSKFDVDNAGCLIRRSDLDGSLQKVVPKKIQSRILYQMHYPTSAGHPGSTRTYNTMRREYYWRNMMADIQETVRRCVSCAKTRGTTRHHQKKMKLFPSAGPLEFVAIDILGPLPVSTSGNRFVLVVTDRFSKLTRSIPMKMTTAVKVAEQFVEQWIIPYGAPDYLLSDNGPQFVAKFFEAICTCLTIKHLTTTAYHPETNGQVERFNRTLVTRIRHYVAEHQKDWDTFVPMLTYAYNTQVHASTGLVPFELVLTRTPKVSLLGFGSTTLRTDTLNSPPPIVLKSAIMRRLHILFDRATKNNKRAQASYKRQVDKAVRTIPSISKGMHVFVDREPTRAKSKHEKEEDVVRSKLLPKSYGPFEVLEADEVTVTIDQNGIPNKVSIDRVTTVPTKRAITTDESLNDRPTETNSDQEFVVERIMDHRDEPDGKRLYKVRWFGYDKHNDTFEPEQNIPTHFVIRYWNRVNKRSAARSNQTTTENDL